MKTLLEYIQKKHITETDYVDLGLPSGTLWAKMNIGAEEGNKPEDWYGLYFAWGETNGYKESDKHNFSWNNYQFGTMGNLSKYNKNDKLTKLEIEDDVVYQITNGKYRMPTDSELKELSEYTDNKWVKDYNEIKGLNGRLFTSKSNGKTLFIPASGYRYGSFINSGDTFDLLSSILNSAGPDCAYTLYAYANHIHISYDERCYGFAVRGVIY